MKLKSKGGKWIIVDGKRTVEFESVKDVWLYIFYMRTIRGADKAPLRRGASEPYPVRSLIPPMGRRCQNAHS